jgi:hypothetical protein
MNELMRESISRSIGEVRRQIRGLDERLADLFGRVAEILPDEKRRRDESERDGRRINEGIAKGILDRIGGGAINTIPFGEPGECLEECIAIAFELLNSRSKYGFNQIALKVNDYWLGCGDINCRTLVITNAWDNFDFYRRYKKFFDSYTSSKNKNSIKHTVAIVLYGDYGFSLQYLR